jgi:hypothetical protein
MKKIMLDHFRRWWWVCLLGGLGCQATAFTAFMTTKNASAGNMFPLIMFLGPFLLSFDLMRGHARTLLSMPVTVPQIARAWWLVAVAIPALALAVMIAIAFVVLSIFSSTPPVMGNAVIYWLMNFLLLGTMFFALSGLPSKQNAASGRDRVRGAIFGALWGISFSVWIFWNALVAYRSVGAVIFISVCSVLTVAGWFNAENMVIERAGLRVRGAGTVKNSKPSRCAEGHGGLRYLSEALAQRILFIGMLMFVFCLFIFWIMNFGKLVNGGSQDSFPLLSMFSFQFLWMMGLQIAPMVSQLRYLRTLPVPAVKLAAIFVSVPAVGMFLVVYLANLLATQMFAMPAFSITQMFTAGYFLQIGVASVFVPLLVWRGISRTTYLAVFSVMLFGMLGILVFHDRLFHQVGSYIAPFLLFGSFYATKWLLENSSQAYRPRNHQMMGWNWTVNR